jgi:hypothetical protein
MKKTQEVLQYKILNKKTNPYDSVIEVTGSVKEITARDILRNITECEKYIREIEANVKIKDATLKNISNSNPIVLRMKEEDICACYLYYEALAFNKESKPKLKELKEQIERNNQYLKDIKEQTGLSLQSNEK